MGLTDIARWLWPRRESNPRPRPSASFPAKSAKAKLPRKSASFRAKPNSPEQPSASTATVRHGKVNRQRVDTEIDNGFVVLHEEADWTSCSDSGSDWSVGWYEPLSSGFTNDNEPDDSFVALVRCYKGTPPLFEPVKTRGKQSEKTRIKSNPSSKDSHKHVEKWLASLNQS